MDSVRLESGQVCDRNALAQAGDLQAYIQHVTRIEASRLYKPVAEKTICGRGRSVS